VKLTWGLNAKVAHLYLKKILKEEVSWKDIVATPPPQESEMHGRAEDAAKGLSFCRSVQCQRV